ncbi:MAG: hypothetical protein GY862_36840, partial [Gammaproteobacteria bacterium]|nr:hypothetical protein [Gammaproteobacteria bacterium]
TVQQGQAAGKGMPADMLRDFGEEGEEMLPASKICEVSLPEAGQPDKGLTLEDISIAHGRNNTKEPCMNEIKNPLQQVVDGGELVKQNAANRGKKEPPLSDAVLGTKEGTKEVLRRHSADWFDVKQFASLTGISERSAREAVIRALAGKPWRKKQYDANWNGLLQDRTVPGTGGRGGIRYEVYAPSLPAELSDKWYSQFAGEVSDVPVQMGINFDV